MKIKHVFAIVLALIMSATLFSCTNTNQNQDDVLPESTDNAEENKEEEEEIVDKYEGPFSEVNGTFGGVDSLGRVLSTTGTTKEERGNKKVGIFYFLWQGQHGTGGPYDNNKIVASSANAIKSETAWKKAGGGNVGEHHFWGEPLFGYYTSDDKWVFRKHCQMLTDAGIDFLVFDATNGYTYSTQVKKLIEVWYEYLEAGYDVPKLSFYTNTSSGTTINALYKELYNNKALKNKYPRLDELWFYYEGKPMVIGKQYDSALSSASKDYFRIKASVWPFDGAVDDGFPWMEFGRLLTDDAVYGRNGRKEVVNVSIAQHNVTCTMSATAWYGAKDRTRSYHDGANDTSEDAILWGYNFQEQWDWALSVDPEMVFVTGWNEWVAQRQPSTSYWPIYFVDCADPNTSRDAEPMNGLFGDNYYMQLIENIRKYKGIEPRVNVGENTTIDIAGSFDQWNNVTAKYSDYKNDTIKRSSTGFGNIKYRNNSGRNDFVTIKAAKDKKNLYFYAETAEDITSSSDENWMTLFINSGSSESEKWEKQFDFCIGLTRSENNADVYKYTDGKWSKIGTAEFRVEGNKMMLKVAKELLSVSGAVDIQFKWADNYLVSDGVIDIFSFYTSGDAAPIGRQTYVFSEKK